MSNFNDLMLNWITSTSTKKDEREKSELNQKLANMFAINYLVTVLTIVFFTIIDMYHHTITMHTIVLFAVFFIFNIILIINFCKNKHFEEAAYSPNEYNKLIRRYSILSVVFMVYFGICMTLMGVIIDYLWNDPIDWSGHLLNGLISGVIFGGLMFCVYLVKLKKEY
ncbi:hypothetical protein [Staphylococcus capitis]|uniref:hypothetical protein n=1 Tax=Staphylococcus capitis TaxID=29388 RepID=UPI001BCDFC98|nr:hypothetical protein [Staphylococcus capitis]